MYYVKNRNGKEIVFRETVPEVVECLENFVKIKFKKTRKVFMDEMHSIGHQPDEASGKNFAQILKEYIDMGIVVNNQNNNRVLKECDIHDYERNLLYKNETGD